MIGFNVGSMMYMLGDSPFIAWMKTGGWIDLHYVQTDSTF